MTSLTLVRRIAARPSIVFDAVATPEGISSWWGGDDMPVVSAEADVSVDGHFKARFRTMDGLEHECIGRFLEISKPVRLVMSWQWTAGGEPEEQDAISRVEFHLRPIETGTELTLVHAALRNEASVRSHENGWDRALQKLMRNFAGELTR